MVPFIYTNKLFRQLNNMNYCSCFLKQNYLAPSEVYEQSFVVAEALDAATHIVVPVLTRNKS